jgi:hypothetical protein
LGKAERGILPALDGSFGFLLCGENSNDFFYSAFHAYYAQDSIYLIYNLKLNYVRAVTSYNYVFFFICIFFGLTRVNPSDPLPDHVTGSMTGSGFKTMLMTVSTKSSHSSYMSPSIISLQLFV